MTHAAVRARIFPFLSVREIIVPVGATVSSADMTYALSSKNIFVFEDLMSLSICFYRKSHE